MIYLRMFDSHSDYEKEAESLIIPNVAWDHEHVHFSSDGESEDEIVYLYYGKDDAGTSIMTNKSSAIVTLEGKLAVVDKNKRYNIVYNVYGEESHTTNHYNVGLGDSLDVFVFYNTTTEARGTVKTNISEITDSVINSYTERGYECSILNNYIGYALLDIDIYDNDTIYNTKATGTIEYNTDGDYVTTVNISSYFGDEPYATSETYKVEDYKEFYVEGNNFDGRMVETIFFFFNQNKRIDISTQNMESKNLLLKGDNVGVGEDISGDESYGYTTKITEYNDTWKYYMSGLASFEGYAVLMPFSYDLGCDEFSFDFKTLAD